MTGGALLLSGSLLAGCSLTGGDDDTEASVGAGSGGGEVVLVTHGDFAMSDALVARFEEETGHTLTVRATGGGGTLTNKLVLTKDSPTGDAAFGVDNTFASRALEEGVFSPLDVELPAGSEQYALPGDPALAPIDVSHVCVNVDTTWFAERELDPPATLDDLTDPAYRDLFVVPGAATSTPGMAFLLSTVAEYGEQWPDYWADLMDNGAKLTSDWSDAYYVDFTQGGESGKRPIVVSYDSSPAFTVAEEGGASTTAALLDTCFRQVEYAGVLAGAKNPEGAAELVEFLLSEDVQAALPESMYVFPVRDDVELPAAWAEHAVQPEDPAGVDPAEIAANRDDWLETWTEVTTR
ncbi:thiamine ABC transporter substrate-binding protein [Nocardioides pacificus]